MTYIVYTLESSSESAVHHYQVQYSGLLRVAITCKSLVSISSITDSKKPTALNNIVQKRL